MIDHAGDVPVALLVRDLIDPDPFQPGKPVGARLPITGHPGADRPHRPPRDTHQLRHRRPGRVHRQPRHQVVEHQRVPRAVTRPRHRDHRRTVLGAVHLRRIRLQPRLHHTEIQTPPATPTLAAVVPRATPATTATPPRSTITRAHMRYQQPRLIVEVDLLDDRPVDAQQPLPYPYRTHAVPLTWCFLPSTSQKPSQRTACGRSDLRYPPTEASGEPQLGPRSCHLKVPDEVQRYDGLTKPRAYAVGRVCCL